MGQTNVEIPDTIACRGCVAIFLRNRCRLLSETTVGVDYPQPSEMVARFGFAPSDVNKGCPYAFNHVNPIIK